VKRLQKYTQDSITELSSSIRTTFENMFIKMEAMDRKIKGGEGSSLSKDEDKPVKKESIKKAVQFGKNPKKIGSAL